MFPLTFTPYPLIKFAFYVICYIILLTLIFLILLLFGKIRKNFKHKRLTYLLLLFIPPIIFYFIYFFLIYPIRCNNVYVVGDRSKCYQDIAVARLNLKICNSITFDYSKWICIVRVSNIFNNVKLCEKYSPERYKDKCKEEVH